MKDEETQNRKAEHIDIAVEKDVNAKTMTTGFERYHFRHRALPEQNFKDIDLSAVFLGKSVVTPFVVSSMTGGTEKAGLINQRLAQAAEKRGWAIGTGSIRAALESEKVAYTYQIRPLAPSVPIFCNLGAVQLNAGYGPNECQRAVELMDADGLVLHLNSLQEVIQHEGDTDFAGLLSKINDLCKELEVPVGVKEVGWGIDGPTAKRLFTAGVSFIDVAGAGGTSWSEVEKSRTQDPVKARAAEAFSGWGIPTTTCIVDVCRRNPGRHVIASGGLRTGLDAAKAIALGAGQAAFGRSILKSAVVSEEALAETMAVKEMELKMAMFGIGATNLEDLQNTDRLIVQGEGKTKSPF
ncbi:type 2 isopentenyl-diphosphate Delta-isomerase [Tuberibacillus sp. Marseille-P3662]|uniref:type 2 isopentenyl-diphosphate Delta-isomerase n=1 Tax=Tuberibacillus sp. Marseille-P3662 TaxID=1965358 RepID=UPI000A1CE721|nr:type 2 isopentenyl-diphosphate Delta-isomerase [Tuberibacillus sp. Marseille-P3662]